MRKTILSMCLCLFSMLTVWAQQEVRVKTLEPQMDDVWAVLEAMNIRAYRFDLSEFLNRVYEVKFHINEYQGGELVKSGKQKMNMGKNKVSIIEFPEEDRNMFHEYFHLPKGTDTADLIKNASVYIIQSDSTSQVVFHIAGAGRSGTRVKLQKLPSQDRVFYSSRPFKQLPVKQENSVMIPLLFYGSGWYDAKYNITRFCGENEINPDLTGDIPTHSPHYYVISVEMKEVKTSMAGE